MAMTRPYYMALAAISIDGRIAQHAGQISDWTSPEDKIWFYSQLDACDAVVVGRLTYDLVAERLAKRNCVVFTRRVSGAEEKNSKLIFLNSESGNLHEELNQRGWKNICVLGGIGVYNYFLEHDLLDDLYVTIEPMIFGDGLPLFQTLITEKRFKLVEVKQLNNAGTLLIHYQKIT